MNINECGVQNTKLNGYNDDISVDSDDNSRNDKNRSPGPSREITRDWDMDASTLSDASEKLQTLVNYLKQKEAQISNRASHEPMTPEMAQELSDRLSGPLALLSDMSRGCLGEDNSAEGNMATIHEGSKSFKCRTTSDQAHVTEIVHDTFKRAFDAGLKMGRGERTQANDCEGEEARDLEETLDATERTKPIIARVMSK